jgi:hypothetical protein
MSALTNYGENKIIDALKRGQALGAPATWYYALITCSKGQRQNSIAYALNDTVVVQIGAAWKLYKCTTAGTTAAALPGTYVGAAGEAITDGGAVFTEQSAGLEDGSAFVEVSGGNYSRASIAASLTAWEGTQGGGATTASSGTGGTTKNLTAAAFPTPNANWHPNGGAIIGYVAYDAATGGNPWDYCLFAPKSVSGTDPAPSLGASGIQLQIDN